MIRVFVNLIRLPVTLVLILVVALLRSCGAKISLRWLLSQCGPSFVKFGQTLSVRPDIVGPEYAAELAGLRDDMKQFSSVQARKIIEKELGRSVQSCFKQFEDIPVAAASVAQVHKAKTHDGKQVAVKILRPNVARDFALDMMLFYWVAYFFSLFRTNKRLRLVEVVDTFAATVRKELDLRMEAAAASKLASNLKSDKDVRVPTIFWSFTSQRVMTSSWVDGVPIHHTEALEKAGHNCKVLAKRMYLNFLNQAYRDGFFHADIHPGNVLVQQDGTIAVVDFGIMGILSDETKFFVAEILRGFLISDYDYVAKVHFDAGYVPADQNLDDFALACRAIGEPILDLPAKDISLAKLLALLFKISEAFNMHTQPQLLLLQKTLVTIEGVCHELDPDINLWECARPWVTNWAKEHMSAKAQVKRNLGQLQQFMCHLPEKLSHLNTSLEGQIADGMKLHPQTIEQLDRPRKRRDLVTWGLLATILTLVGIQYL